MILPVVVSPSFKSVRYTLISPFVRPISSNRLSCMHTQKSCSYIKVCDYTSLGGWNNLNIIYILLTSGDNMKTFKSPEKRQEALALAQDMCGVEKIRAYQFAGRSDLARAYANTLLIGDGISYGTGHYAGSPYAPDDWRVLKLKRRFDAIGAPYNVEAAKKGLLYSHIEVSEDRPSQKDIRTIDELLETHGIPGSERTNIFMRMRDTRREKIHPLSHEVSRFCLGRIKDTGYSNVAARTGIPRNETVTFYLDKFFAGDTEGIRIEHLYYYAEDLGGKLNSLIQREHLNGAEIASRVLRLLEGSGNPRMNLGVIDELCKIPSVGLPKEVVLRALEEFVACEGELREGQD